MKTSYIFLFPFIVASMVFSGERMFNDDLVGSWELCSIHVAGAATLLPSNNDDQIHIIFLESDSCHGTTQRNYFWSAYSISQTNRYSTNLLSRTEALDSELGETFFSIFQILDNDSMCVTENSLTFHHKDSSTLYFKNMETGIEVTTGEMVENNFTILSNNKRIKISFTEHWVQGKCAIHLFTSNGKLVQRFDTFLNGSKFDLPAHDISNGAYFIRISTDKHQVCKNFIIAQ